MPKKKVARIDIFKAIAGVSFVTLAAVGGSTPHALADEEMAMLEEQYRHALYERWKMLDFKGIMHVDMNRPISIPLTDVFIFPDVLLGIPEHETLEREGELPLYERYLQQKIKQTVRQREALHSALAKHRRLVLLGDPGSGKSTLLRYLLLKLVEGVDAFTTTFPETADVAMAIPLYMPLATYAEVLRSNVPGSRSLEDFLPIYLRDNYLGAYGDFIQEQLQQGNLFLLFDGLDEIPDTALRMDVARHVEMFTQAHTTNRFIVTSRIVGYKAASLSAEYQAYTLADFNEDQIRKFAQQWCPAYEYWVQDVRESQYLEDAATREAENLFNATQSKPGVKRLAVNPLLLTILALIQRQGIELPSHRVELFELCAITLIDTWVKAKGRGHTTRFDKNGLIKILRPLAFWMHEHPAVGAIPEEDLHDQIVRQLVGRMISEHEATMMAEQFLETVRGKTGILVERGKARYGFLHLTFEEYFAALELEKRKDKHAFIRAHLHDPRWREVILLTVGTAGILRSDEEEVTELVHDVIANAGSPYEQYLHRDLLFAGLCLADDVGVNVACEKELLEEIIYLYLTSPFEGFRTSCATVLTEWNGTKIAEKAGQLIFPLLRQWTQLTHSPRVFSASSPFDKALAGHIEQSAIAHQATVIKQLRFHITVLLAHTQALDELDWRASLLGIVSEESVRERMRDVFAQYADRQMCITEALLVALSDPDKYVRQNAIVALQRPDIVQSPDVINALLSAVFDTDYKVSGAALAILGQCESAQYGVIEALQKVLSYSKDAYVRRAAVRALGQLARSQPHVVSVLLVALTDIDEIWVRKAAATALAKVGQRQAHVVDALLIALADSDEDVREAAADALAKLCERKKADAIDTLLIAVTDPTANAIGQLSSNPTYVTEILLHSFSNTDRAREAAANVLGIFGERQIHTIDVLLTSLTSSASWSLKVGVVRALRYLGEGPSRVIDVLLSTLGASPSSSLRREVVRVLGQLNAGEPRIIDALLNAVTDASWRVRKEAIEALGQLTNQEPRVIDALLNAMADISWRVRKAVVRALASLDKKQSSILDILLAALADYWVKEDVIKTLGEFDNGEPRIVEAFLLALADWNMDVQKEAIQALGNLIRLQPEIAHKLLQALAGDEIVDRATQTYKERLFANFVERALGILRCVGTHQSSIADLAFLLLALPDFRASTSGSIRTRAEETLGQLGKKNLSVVNRLLSLPLDGDDPYDILQAFGEFGAGKPQVIDKLLLALSDSETFVRWSAALALRQCGKGQHRVIEALLRARTDDHEVVRSEIIHTLGSLGVGQPQVVEAALQALSDRESGYVRSCAAIALRLLNDGQTQIIEALLRTFSEPSIRARTSAVAAIGHLWNGQVNVIEALYIYFSHADLLTKVSTLRVLSGIQNKQYKLIDALFAKLADPSWLAGETTIEALNKPADSQLAVVRLLLSALTDPLPEVRKEAARALQLFEHSQPEVVEALLKATSDADWTVREAVASALSVSQIQVEAIGSKLAQMLQDYESMARRDLRDSTAIFSALQEIAKKL